MGFQPFYISFKIGKNYLIIVLLSCYYALNIIIIIYGYKNNFYYYNIIVSLFSLLLPGTIYIRQIYFITSIVGTFQITKLFNYYLRILRIIPNLKCEDELQFRQEFLSMRHIVKHFYCLLLILKDAFTGDF